MFKIKKSEPYVEPDLIGFNVRNSIGVYSPIRGRVGLARADFGVEARVFGCGQDIPACEYQLQLFEIGDFDDFGDVKSKGDISQS